MATNTAAPNGLVYSRNIYSASPTYQANGYVIHRGYASNINVGDLVKTLTGADQGYVGLATTAEVATLGVFAGITSLVNGIVGANGGGYYDINFQAVGYGLNGAYVSTILPPVGTDIGALVISDLGAVFRVQMIGGPYTQLMRGQNINFTAATNGVTTGNGAFGMSSLSVDATTINITNTLPLRIVGLAGIPGSNQDPTNTNPFIEVMLNTPEQFASTGI